MNCSLNYMPGAVNIQSRETSLQLTDCILHTNTVLWLLAASCAATVLWAMSFRCVCLNPCCPVWSESAQCLELRPGQSWAPNHPYNGFPSCKGGQSEAKPPSNLLCDNRDILPGFALFSLSLLKALFQHFRCYCHSNCWKYVLFWRVTASWERCIIEFILDYCTSVYLPSTPAADDQWHFKH